MQRRAHRAFWTTDKPQADRTALDVLVSANRIEDICEVSWIDEWESKTGEYTWRKSEHGFGFLPSQGDWPALQGPHNSQNVGASKALSFALGIDDATVSEALRTYPGLPHRMERIREKDGVVFVNDSKATNPTATAPALAAFERIRWKIGRASCR